MARGAFGPLLDGLHPRGRVEADNWVVDGAARTVATDLLLAPMVTTSRAVLLGTAPDTPDDEGDVAFLAYPLPGAHRLLDRSRRLPPTKPTALEALLGVPRATILQGLDRPVSAGRLPGTSCSAPAPSPITSPRSKAPASSSAGSSSTAAPGAPRSFTSTSTGASDRWWGSRCSRSSSSASGAAGRRQGGWRGLQCRLRRRRCRSMLGCGAAGVPVRRGLVRR
jgi:hypothetical protein